MSASPSGDLLDHVGGFALAFKAAAIKQPLGGAPEADAPKLGTVQFFRDAGAEGIFGPPVAVSNDVPMFDRSLGIAGRDPAWTPPA